MSRARDDACPGALQVHQGADGPLVRIRLPGGMITAGQLDVLAETATKFGDGGLQLTSRGNVQLRGLTNPRAVADAVAGAGLLPSPTHERVRNIIASPLTGRAGGEGDLRPVVTALDEAIRARPGLADLPGRFLFGLDDGTGDVSGLAADAGVRLTGDGAALLLAGRHTGCRLGTGEVPEALVTVAARFVETRGQAWRIAELDDPDALLDGFAVGGQGPPPTVTPAIRPPVGWIVQDDGRVALGAAVPLGVLSARQARFVAAIGAPVVITPWRSLLVCDLDEGVADTALRVLAPLGLVFDAGSRWIGVSACVGSPGCGRSRADVRAEAARVAQGVGPESPPGSLPVHYAGCERACGRPAGARVLIATGGGYLPVVGRTRS